MIPGWETERRAMVDRQLRRRGIRDARVLRAMGEIPREEPPDLRVMAYGDSPVQIGWGQTISQPYMTALMAQELELTGTETVLEICAGSGYAAAVLGALAGPSLSGNSATSPSCGTPPWKSFRISSCVSARFRTRTCESLPWRKFLRSSAPSRNGALPADG